MIEMIAPKFDTSRWTIGLALGENEARDRIRAHFVKPAEQSPFIDDDVIMEVAASRQNDTTLRTTTVRARRSSRGRDADGQLNKLVYIITSVHVPGCPLPGMSIRRP